MNRTALFALAFCLTLAPGARAVEANPVDPAVGALLRDYIGLYTADALPRWRELFLPGFVAASTNEDGSVTTRSLDEFYERQRTSFAGGAAVSEVLENTRIHRTGKLATVTSDFVWKGSDVTRRGRLILVLVEAGGRFRIHSLAFSYHG
jgi:hypothetical protein